MLQVDLLVQQLTVDAAADLMVLQLTVDVTVDLLDATVDNIYVLKSFQSLISYQRRTQYKFYCNFPLWCFIVYARVRILSRKFGWLIRLVLLLGLFDCLVLRLFS